VTAAKLLGEIAGAQRFATEAKLARAAGVAPIPVSSGKTHRHRLDRGGNRQLNTAIHRIALTRARCHPETQHYLARQRASNPARWLIWEPRQLPHQRLVNLAPLHAQGTDSRALSADPRVPAGP